MAATATPQSGTKDKNYDLITVTHLCLEHVWRLEQYAQDADRELALRLDAIAALSLAPARDDQAPFRVRGAAGF